MSSAWILPTTAATKPPRILPFLEWDLSLPCPLRAPYGYCCDVMEHIPPDQVDAVLSNIKDSAETVVFRIEYEPDVMGKLIGVQPCTCPFIRKTGGWPSWQSISPAWKATDREHLR
jgi:hypothetical protein